MILLLASAACLVSSWVLSNPCCSPVRQIKVELIKPWGQNESTQVSLVSKVWILDRLDKMQTILANWLANLRNWRWRLQAPPDWNRYFSTIRGKEGSLVPSLLTLRHTPQCKQDQNRMPFQRWMWMDGNLSHKDSYQSLNSTPSKIRPHSGIPAWSQLAGLPTLFQAPNWADLGWERMQRYAAPQEHWRVDCIWTLLPWSSTLKWSWCSIFTLGQPD